MISFFLPIAPRQKGNSKRIVARGRGGRPFVIGKEADRRAEHDVVLLARRFAPPAPLEGPIRLDVTFVVDIPASWSRRKRADALSGAILPDTRPDRGNYLKLIEDALQSAGFYRDDSQIIAGDVSKRYGPLAGYVVHVERARGSRTPADVALVYARLAAEDDGITSGSPEAGTDRGIPAPPPGVRGRES